MSSEKFPQFKRPEPKVVGLASAEKKEEYKKLILDRFGESHYDEIPEDKRRMLESLEYEKKPYEKLAIKQANEITNSLLEEFGLTPFDVPERNIHIVPEKLYQEVESDGDKIATTSQHHQLIALNAEKLVHPAHRASVILHEITHLKNYLAIEGLEEFYKPYRSGFKISPTYKKEEQVGFFTAFSGLDEAVVSEIEKRYFSQLISQNEFLKKEYEWGESEEAQELKEKIAKEKSRKPDEVMVVSKDRGYKFFPYYEQRKVLNYIVDQLYADNKDKYSTRDDVMKSFFKAHFDGRLLGVAKLIEKSFGKGSFRMLSMMNSESNSSRQVMDYLRKQRRIK